MDGEHEMCQNCKRDIPVPHYRTHTLHCKRTVYFCKDCCEPILREDLEEHNNNIHSLRICDQCGISVEARKLVDHREFLCSKVLLTCKYCETEHPASSMSEHEQKCGEEVDQCAKCYEWVERKCWDQHQSQLHRVLVQRSPMRQRKQDNQTGSAPQDKSADTTAMLPCEFCEGLVPIQKLLEHQAECVNPRNVRGSSILQSSTNLDNSSSNSNLTSFHPQQQNSGLARSQSMHANSGSSYKTDQDNSSFAERYSRTSNYNYNRSLCRTSSVREGRATTEERSLIRSSSLYRQASFTERSYRRRSESLSRQNSVSRASRYGGFYSSQYTSDYISSTRRTSLFDGYSGYAVYSSISQGLDDISYGGRLSRRSSVTDLTTTSPDLSIPTLVATYEATKVNHCPARENNNNNINNVVDTPKISVICSESETIRAKDNQQAKRLEPPVVNCVKISKSKIKRKVSFTDKDPVIIKSREEVEEPRKPRRSKKDPREKVVNKNKHRNMEERRKSQPLGDELFEQVSTKLRALELEQEQQIQSPPVVQVVELTYDNNNNNSNHHLNNKSDFKAINASAFGCGDSTGCCSSEMSSKDTTSTEASPKQKQRNRNSFGILGMGSSQESNSDVPSAVMSAAPVRLRKLSNDSKSSSKRSSLDAKSVQNLAQDLAAECAKAYTMMENSLSKLASASGGPFGVSRNKKSSRAK